jgi:hypothetical protein
MLVLFLKEAHGSTVEPENNACSPISIVFLKTKDLLPFSSILRFPKFRQYFWGLTFFLYRLPTLYKNKNSHREWHFIYI